MQFRHLQAAVFILMILGNVALPSGEGRPHGEESSKEKPTIKPSFFTHLQWRNIGPSIMCGRVADVEGVPGNQNVVYVGSFRACLWAQQRTRCFHDNRRRRELGKNPLHR